MKKKAALHNLGCKVNAYETEVMEQLLKEDGYEIVPFAPGADVYVINTCTVTNVADRKSRQMLHRARKMNPDAVVVAVGCYVQTAGDAAADPAVDLVLGNNRKHELTDAIRRFEAARKEKCGQGLSVPREESREAEDWSAAEPVSEDSGHSSAAETKSADTVNTSAAETKSADTVNTSAAESADRDSEDHLSYAFVSDISQTREYEPMFLSSVQQHTRAYLKVQDGCNQFCSYCIIPFARGRVRSRKVEETVSEVRALAADGCQEIVLTGIHLSSYGVDHGSSLMELIRAVHEVDGISRIRLGSLEPGIVTEEFAYGLAEFHKVCPHFHLSLQSGCDATLKRMNRRYTTSEYAAKCELLRQAFSQPALTTDVIVGFPGETEEEFETTVRFLERISFYETHIFKYSRRQGTRAAVMDGQIPEPVKTRRSERLIALGDEKRRSFEQSWIGRPAEVLMEEKLTLNGTEYYTGYTKEYLKTVIPADRDYTNVRMTGILGREIAPHILLLDCRGASMGTETFE